MKLNACEIKQSLLEWIEDISNHVDITNKAQVNYYLSYQNQMYICVCSKGNVVIYSAYGDDDIDIGCEIYISDKDISIVCKNQKAIHSVLNFLPDDKKYIDLNELLSINGVFNVQ